MPIIRTFAVQGHEIPSVVHNPRGPFPPEVLAQPRMSHEDAHADSLHVGLDDVRFFRCKNCDDILTQEDLDTHECSE
jgi:hypothetical protein